MYVLAGLRNTMKCLWMITFPYACLIGSMLYIIKEEDGFSLWNNAKSSGSCILTIENNIIEIS